jgi:hypothetical protein
VCFVLVDKRGKQSGEQDRRSVTNLLLERGGSTRIAPYPFGCENQLRSEKPDFLKVRPVLMDKLASIERKFTGTEGAHCRSGLGSAPGERRYGE